MTKSGARGHGDGGRRRWWALLAVAACLVTAFASGVGPASGPAFGAGPDVGYGAAASAGPAHRVGSASSRGQWAVRRTAAGLRLVWRSPVAVPVSDARPQFRAGARILGYPRLGADGRTLTLVLPGHARVERARLQVWVGLRRLDAPAALPAGPLVRTGPGGPLHRLRTLATTPSADPGLPGPYAVHGFDYRAAPMPWRPYPEPIEVLGHAVLPVGVDHAPLVLFLHGRHYFCYGPGDTGRWPCTGNSQPIPSYLGYRYLQRLLASQGYATVSISANAINAQDDRDADGGARARGALVLHHLALLARRSANPTRTRWYGRLDLQRVVTVGHSRGGEGVDQAAIDRPAGAPYRIVGQVLIGPTDFAYQTASYLPTEVLLPYCDGDVSDLQGQRFVDFAQRLAPDDPSLRSSVLLMGANHNFFNTEWTPRTATFPDSASDDWWDQSDPVCGRKASVTRLNAAEQRRAAKSFVAAGVHAFLGDDTAAALPWLDSGDPVELPQAGPAVALTAALGGDRRTVRLGSGAVVSGGATRCREGQALDKPVDSLCGPPDFSRVPHWTPRELSWAWTQSAYFASGLGRDARLAWSQPGLRGGFALDQPLDLSAPGATLDLRVVVDPATGPVSVRVVLGSGARSWAGPRRALSPLPGTSWLSALWGQTLRVDPADFAGHVDLAAVDRVELQAANAAGQVWVLDASRRLPDLAPVPATTLPRLRLGHVVQTEGPPGDRVAEVPFRVLGQVTSPARFGVAADQWTFNEGSQRPWFSTVTVDPGQTAGTIPVPYEADDVDDLARQVQAVWAVPKRGILTSGDNGRATILDDDPSPRVTFAPAHRRVHYGADLVFELRLSKPVDYWAPNFVRAVRVPGLRPLRTSDVPPSWLEAQMGEVPADVPLARVWHYGYIELRPGSTLGTVTVPTLRRPLHPVTKWLTLRFRSSLLEPVRPTATVRVSPR
ncbi:MAG TPA: hypothetical protein VFL69_14570 [Marmoricola sp.]|nr:hypothetical protein [Marmoricola sp.]